MLIGPGSDQVPVSVSVSVPFPVLFPFPVQFATGQVQSALQKKKMQAIWGFGKKLAQNSTSAGNTLIYRVSWLS